MVKIIAANETHIEVLALLGTITYAESHACFIEDEKDLDAYLKTAFSIAQVSREMKNLDNHFYLLLKDDLPIAYAKLVTNVENTKVGSDRACMLERIYVLKHFIPLKIGQRFLDFLEKKVKEMEKDTIWLTVYSKNMRAIKFYEKNNYQLVGDATFQVNETSYKNLIYSKKFEIITNEYQL